MEVKPEETLCLDGDASKLIDQAPLPTARTLRQRSNLVLQFFRFLSINMNIMRMVWKGHGD